MNSFKHRDMPERFSFHLAEAIDALGYYRIDAVDQLLAMYRQQWPRGLSSTMLRISDIQHMMTEKGLADPYHAQKATHLRAQFNLSREEFDQSEPEWSKITSRVSFAARAMWLCDRARELDGTVVSAAERWPLPFLDCGQEWCPCRWDWLPDAL